MAYKEPPQVTIIPAPAPQPSSTGSSSSSGVGGAVVNGIFGLGQSLLNNHFANKSAQKQYDRQVEFWNMQNAYNSPLAQRYRMQAAGFNPSAVVGEVASGQQAGELSSVPGNEYAQNGVLRLEGLAQTLEIMSRIEKLGAETGLLTTQMTTEALEQTLLGLGIDKAEVEYIIAQYEAQGKAMELENLPYFYEHTRTMYSLEESYKSAQIDHENALKLLSDAHTEESKANAERLVAETGLIAIKAATEKSIQQLNYSHKSHIDWETRKSVVLAPLQRRALTLANELSASETQKHEIETAMQELELRAKQNDDGDANAWYYIDEAINAIGTILGVAVGTAIGGSGKSKAVRSGAGSGLYVPGSTNISGQSFVRL